MHYRILILLVCASAVSGAEADIGSARSAVSEASWEMPARSIPLTLATASTPPPSFKSMIPQEFANDSGLFCQGRIGVWTLADARALLGEPLRRRPSAAGDPDERGTIYAFRDPSGRYRELELSFGSKGRLRAVYAYPDHLTWEECRRRWGGKTAALPANKGRTFYSYLDRRLDVLVAPAGTVINLGLY